MELQKDNMDMEFQDANVIVKYILKNIKERCKFEAESKDVVVPLKDYRARVEYYTGLPNYFIEKLISNKSQISMLPLQSRITILEAVRNIYKSPKIPVYPIIYAEATKNGQLNKTDDTFIEGLDAFVTEMEILGYEWKKNINHVKIVIEDPEVRFERYIYLNKLKKYRKNTMQWQQIVYIDERLVNDSQTFQKPWLANPPPMDSPEFDECVFYHAVSKNGYITGMFSNQVTENDFTKWLADILLMHLKTPCIIIMDNNPLHGSLEHVSSISRYHTKTDMLRWLTNHNVPSSSNMSKPALYELIKKCNEEQKEYKIDSIIRSQGHEVLRLPRHLFDLSMTTPLWNNIIKNGDFGVTNSLMHLQNQLIKFINGISLSNWVEYEHTIEKYEKEFFNIDMSMESLSDKYEIKIST